ncbi:STAS-like domain-containing protein [Collimonas fungivorans]|uniref:STAS-like domain-containing protein n=1 Tax=Collimonas fungivorans TaxID=158899 RepID=UPI003FA39B64
MDKLKIRTICQLVDASGQNVAARLAEKEGISRQAASTWLAKAKEAGIISSEGTGRGIRYALVAQDYAWKDYLREGLSEDVVWRELCAPMLRQLPSNARGIWQHAMTEMINNAVDHSNSEQVKVGMKMNALFTEGFVSDTGEGIFLKIQKALDLYDTREAILELAKGKFTTDPVNHSGEGIFFSSKMMDHYEIRSGKLHFDHDSEQPDLLIEHDVDVSGTLVSMRLDNDSARTAKEVFDRFALPEEFSFAKTTVPVRLAQHEGETLVSRSQAKRLTGRFERFQSVILDFSGVDEIGQAFADEVFRVFQNAHPEISMIPFKASASITAMIKRVQNPT